MAKKARSDGFRTRGAIINAADAMFAEHGFEVPLALIAERAGVSRMTLSRHFADREALGLAISERNVADLQERANTWAETEDGYLLLLNHLMELYVGSIGLAQALTRQATGMARLEELRRHIVAIFAPLLVTAKRSGLVGQHIQDEDLYLLMDMFEGALGKLAPQQRQARAQRALELLMGGLR